jgi:hypothetical protein
LWLRKATEDVGEAVQTKMGLKEIQSYFQKNKEKKISYRDFEQVYFRHSEANLRAS